MKRIGSLSSASSDNYATIPLLEASHSSASVVLPEPAGAETTVRGRLSVNELVRRGRGTIGWRRVGGRSFVFGMDMEEFLEV